MTVQAPDSDLHERFEAGKGWLPVYRDARFSQRCWHLENPITRIGIAASARERPTIEMPPAIRSRTDPGIIPSSSPSARRS
jgi:hypothetical protein